MFSGASNIDSYASGKEVVSVKLPSVSSRKGSQLEDSDESNVIHSQSRDASSFPALNQQIPDLVTLSLLPKSQWQSLINLDIIKVFLQLLVFQSNLTCYPLYGWLSCRVWFNQLLTLNSVTGVCNIQERNKPIEPPKKPEKAPFFLPSVPSFSGEILFKPSEAPNEETGKDQLENHEKKSDINTSQFLHFLQSCAEMRNCKYANLCSRGV